MNNRTCAVVLLALVAALALFVFGGAILLAGATGLLGWSDLGSTRQHVQMLLAGLAGVGGAVGIGFWMNRLGKADEEERCALMPAETAAPREDYELARWTVGPEEWRAFAASERRHANREAVIVAVSAFVTVMIPFAFFGAWEIGLAVAGGFAALATGYRLWLAHRTLADDLAAGRGEVVVRRNSVEINGASSLLENGRWWIAGTRFLPDASPAMLEIVLRRTSHSRHGPRTVDQVLRVPVARGSEDEARRIASGDLRRPLPPGADPDDPDAP